jgi:2-polyprenyl-3-methyl-5-hydroxy-6-metoxy-1,4-benzoquinol methylase
MPNPSNIRRFTQILNDPRRGFRWLQRVTRRALGLDITSNGERVDIVYDGHVNFAKLDMYQKSHFRRYQFACRMLQREAIVGDMACGTGYGTVMMGAAARRAYGYDISPVINVVQKRYSRIENVSFTQGDLLEIKGKETFDTIVSFETLEHFPPALILEVLKKFNSLLVRNGRLIISTPYNQEETAASRVHHRSFYINERLIKQWVVDAGFTLDKLFYQNYATHEIEDNLLMKDFMIATCTKSRSFDQ